MRKIFVLFALFGCLLVTAGAQEKGNPPVIVSIGLADTANMTGILPLNSMKTVPVGMVRFRALVKDADGNLSTLTNTAGTSSGSMWMTPTAKSYIGIGVDKRRGRPGEKVTYTVIATDSAGNRASKSVTVTLQ